MLQFLVLYMAINTLFAAHHQQTHALQENSLQPFPIRPCRRASQKKRFLLGKSFGQVSKIRLPFDPPNPSDGMASALSYCKGYSWDHFVGMLFCELAQAKSLREICGGLSCCLAKLRPFGIQESTQ